MEINIHNIINLTLNTSPATSATQRVLLDDLVFVVASIHLFVVVLIIVVFRIRVCIGVGGVDTLMYVLVETSPGDTYCLHIYVFQTGPLLYCATAFLPRKILCMLNI